MGNDRRFPAWQAAAIRQLAMLPGVDIALLIVRDGASRGAGKLRRLRDIRHLLWTLFNKGYVERRSRASHAVDLTEMLADVPEIRVRTVPVGRFGERFTDGDVATIRDQGLDVILRFSFGIIKGEILEAATYGVWSFHHGDERKYRGRPPGFWELYEGEAVVGAILQRLTERLDGGIVLHRGFFATVAHSYRKTRDELFFGTSVWPSIVVRQLQLGDTDMVDAAPSQTNAAIRYDPTNPEMLRFLLRQAGAFVRAQVRGVGAAAMWSIGVADAPISAFLDGRPEISWLAERGRHRYLADPFAIEHDGGLVALVEDYDYKARRGTISAVALDGDRRPQTAIDAGVHASYPYLLEAAGEVYCIPETFEAGEVRLYKAVDFPLRWEIVATLLDGMAALDATVVEHEGRWWLFCTDRTDFSNTKLYVFHAHAITGPWHPHALNPVKTDVRSARPAGTPFVHDGRLYRPAQDASESYGGAVSINRIDELTPTRFAEHVVATVRPAQQDRYRDGLHTISAAGGRTVVDGRRDTFVWPATKHEFAARLRKLRPGR